MPLLAAMPGRFWLCHRDRACAETALRAAAILVRSGEATVILAYRSGRLSIARDRFEVLGVRGDINKSTTFGTEDKCNPLEATIGAALRYQTLRSLTATEIGAGTVNVAMFYSKWLLHLSLIHI